MKARNILLYRINICIDNRKQADWVRHEYDTEEIECGGQGEGDVGNAFLATLTFIGARFIPLSVGHRASPPTRLVCFLCATLARLASSKDSRI